MAEIIKFYRTNDSFGCFSNFAAFPILLDGKEWPTSEHYFQGQKFEDASHQEAIRLEKSPMIVARMGRDRSKKLRKDWELVKDQIMLIAVRAKFTQHEELRSVLLGTGEAELIEHTKNDNYWGDGGDGTGKNMLGKILMKARAEIQESLDS